MLIDRFNLSMLYCCQDISQLDNLSNNPSYSGKTKESILEFLNTQEYLDSQECILKAALEFEKTLNSSQNTTDEKNSALYKELSLRCKLILRRMLPGVG